MDAILSDAIASSRTTGKPYRIRPTDLDEARGWEQELRAVGCDWVLDLDTMRGTFYGEDWTVEFV